MALFLNDLASLHAEIDHRMAGRLAPQSRQPPPDATEIQAMADRLNIIESLPDGQEISDLLRLVAQLPPADMRVLADLMLIAAQVVAEAV